MSLLHDMEDFHLTSDLWGGAPTLTTTAPVIYTILASDNNADYITSAQVEKSRPIRVDRWTSLGREGNWPPRLSYRRRTDVSNRRPIDSLQPDTPKFDKKALLNQRSGGMLKSMTSEHLAH